MLMREAVVDSIFSPSYDYHNIQCYVGHFWLFVIAYSTIRSILAIPARYSFSSAKTEERLGVHLRGRELA